MSEADIKRLRWLFEAIRYNREDGATKRLEKQLYEYVEEGISICNNCQFPYIEVTNDKKPIDKIPKVTKEESLQHKSIAVYSEFCLRLTGLEAKFGKEGGLQGQAMKEIIIYFFNGYLRKKEKEGLHTPNTKELRKEIDDLVFQTIQLLFSEETWNKLTTSFLKNSIKLNQINANLPNILKELKDAAKKSGRGEQSIEEYEQKIANGNIR